MPNVFAFEGFIPVVHESAFIHPNATVTGNVVIGRDVYVGPGAAIRGDWGGVIIEDGCNIQENCTIHMFPGVTVVLEASAHIGHGAVVHGARIGRNALVGMNAVVMDRAVVGAESIVGALCFVPADMIIPPRTVVAGNPARAVKQVSDDMLQWKTEGTRLYQGLPERLRGLAPAGRAAPPDAAPSAPSSRRRTRHGTRPGRRPRPTESKACDCRVTRRVNGSPGPAGPTELFHAVTGEKIAESTSEGLDFKGMLEYGRRVGGPKLRAMTFHQRARMLKAMAQHLMAGKEELYQVSAGTGATKADSWIDIEGGIGTFFAYASQGRREFPDETFYVDGSVERISKGGSFLARHLCVPLEGVAVHINAFNFPCWGMLEKLAPTFLAGMPAIVKPATVTSYLTERMARSMVSAGILPEGALQIICGGVGDLLDHLTCQDVVTFTGSSATGRKLKSHPRVIAESVRFNLEADSLNYCILGPDAAPGSEEFDLFVKEVTKEMTVEGGAEVHRHPANHGAGGDDRGRGPGALEAARRRHAGRPVGGRGPDGAAGRPRTGGRGRRERGVDRRVVRAGLRRSGSLRGGGRRRGEGRLLPVAAATTATRRSERPSRTTWRRSVR